MSIASIVTEAPWVADESSAKVVRVGVLFADATWIDIFVFRVNKMSNRNELIYSCLGL